MTASVKSWVPTRTSIFHRAWFAAFLWCRSPAEYSLPPRKSVINIVSRGGALFKYQRGEKKKMEAVVLRCVTKALPIEFLVMYSLQRFPKSCSQHTHTQPYLLLASVSHIHMEVPGRVLQHREGTLEGAVAGKLLPNHPLKSGRVH